MSVRNDGGHAEELRRAVAAIRGLRARVGELEASGREPVAVIGMACRYPGGADTPEKYWALLRDGVDATTDVPPERWDNDAYYDPDPDVPGKLYVKRAGFLREPLDGFDAEFFGISPREAASLDPMQRLLLEVSWEAIERAGIAPHTLNGSDTGMFLGVCPSDWFMLLQASGRLEEDPYGATGAAPSVAAGRLSYVLGLQGPTVSVDTACSSSLVAITLAVQHLRSRACSLALAGGVQLMLSPDVTVLNCRMHMLSPGGRCRTFDADADGYARAEGAGMLVLKRLADALADGDPIHAVIRGAAFNHDGRSSGLTVPNAAAQRAVIRAALANAGLVPDDIGYVEAHGTGTALGDPIEVRALAEVFGPTRDEPLVIGSVKTNLGHMEPVAGVAGVMKVALSLSHRLIPPHLNVTRPTPHVDWQHIPLRIALEAIPWDGERVRLRAGVSAFGFSGTNAHLVLEPAPLAEGPPTRAPRAAELIVLSGRSRQAVRALALEVAGAVHRVGDAGLPDLAVTLDCGRSPMPFRATAVAGDAQKMALELERMGVAGDDEVTHAPDAPQGRVAFLFTGQGAQYPGMGGELLRGSPVFRQAIERCDEILAPHLERSLLSLLTEVADPEVLRATAYAQPALFAVEYALATLWRSWGIEPAFVAGHSLGEYVAATFAGVMELEEALPLVALRGRLMQQLPAGGRMAAVAAPEADVLRALADVPCVSLAAVNAPTSCVVSGDAGAVLQLMAVFAERGVTCKELQVSHAFHSHRMDPMLDRFEEAVRALRLRPPSLGLVSNLTGRLLTDSEAVDATRWRRHVREPVRFGSSFETLAQLGVRTFVETGPHPVLLALGAASLLGPEYRWVPSMRRGEGQWRRLLASVGELYRAGFDIDWRAYGSDHGGRRVVAPTYAFQRKRYWAAPKPTPRGKATAAAVVAGAHPLLGRLVRSPVQESQFECTLDPARQPLLTDHKVTGLVVFPAAGFVELARAAWEALHGPGPVRLEEGWIRTALVLGSDDGTVALPDVRLVLTPSADGPAAFEIFSRDPTASPSELWRRHSGGHVRAASPPYDAGAFATVQGHCHEPADMDAYHARVTAARFEYGPSYRALQAAWRAEGEAWGELRLPDSASTAGLGIYPGMLDAAFQLTGLAHPGDPGDERFLLPTGYRAVQIWETKGGEVRACCRVREADEHRVVVDIAIERPDGTPVLQVEELSFRAMTGDQFRQVTGAGLEGRLLELRWHERPPSGPVAGAAPATETTASWVVLAEDAAAAAPVLARLQARHASAHWLGPAEVPGLLRALEAGSHEPLAGVIDLRPAGAPAFADGVGPDALPSRLLSEGAVGASLALLRALATGPARPGLRVLLVTRAAQQLAPEERVDPLGAALWGLGATAAAELPWCRLALVDTADPAAEAAGLAELALADDAEDRVALRGTRVYLGRLERLATTVAAAEDPAARLRPDAAYLVTGGLGALGLHVADWLATRGARHLVLLGRRAPSPAAAASIAALEARGVDVRVLSADVSRFGDLDVLRQPELPTVRGVVHAAGVLADALLARHDAERLRHVLAPKADGALHLLQALDPAQLDFVLFFSSASGLLGSAGQAAYAAANAFLDGYARRLRAGGVPALSIGWAAWAGEGMAGKLDEGIRRRWQAAGVGRLGLEEAFVVLDEALELPAPYVLALPGGWDSSLRQAETVPPLLSAIARRPGPAAQEGTRTGARSDGFDRPGFLAAEPDARRVLLADYVRKCLGRILAIEPDELGLDVSIRNLGLDSLMALEARNRIQSDTGMILPVARLLDGPSVTQLADELLAMFAASAASDGGAPGAAAADVVEGEI
jgi:acyl transferase domain-containing protein